MLTGWASSARAADPDPYGQVARWGATGTDRIGQAVGFAADPVDDSVYIVDQQSSNAAAGEATFRLRKFAGDTGVVEGSATFTARGPLTNSLPSIGGVAVDHGARHVYLTVTAQNTAEDFPALQQIKVFSTDVSGGTLSAPGDVADGNLLDTVPSLVWTAPIAVDPQTHDVLVAGLDGADYSMDVRRVAGVAAGGGQPGDAVADWNVVDPNTPAPVSLAVAASGDVLLAWKVDPSVSLYDLVRVTRLSADLRTATPFLPTTAQGGQGIIAGIPPDPDFSSGSYGAKVLGSALATAPDGSLLATTIGVWRPFTGVAIADPFAPSGTFQSAIGVRRLSAAGDDGGIVGGGTASGSCSISRIAAATGSPAGAFGIQLGSAGTFYAISTLADGTNEIVRFGPGGSGCPVPSASFAVRANGQTVPTDGTVPIGAETTLDLSGADLRGWDLLEVDWDVDGDSSNGFEVTDRRPLPSVDPTSPAPALTHRVTYNSARTVTVRARLLTTGGTREISREIRVAAAAIAPTASLSVPSFGTGGQAVTLDASGSRAQPDGSTATLRFEWKFGDGGDWTVGTARQAHTYANPAGNVNYTVQVRVTDTSSGLATLSATRTITIRPAAVQDPCVTNPSSCQPPPSCANTPSLCPPPVRTCATDASLCPKPPADTTAPALTFKATTAVPSTGLLSLQLGCPAAETSCSGSVEVKTASAVAASAAAKRKARARRSILTLGRATFTATGGATANVKVKLSAAGKKLLARAKKLKVLVTVVTRDAAGNASTLRKTLTLTVARARARGRKKK
ncbi:PKD domain-containing protein [Conexibacter sp. JD483]|uniref:PKD domain-containing protein n=1 Tax=unclassified Conexibacter TaxID=2627773 RepID=UPI00271E1F3F|nr:MULTISPECIES: PKD domain-containing protein [unclassified Conexibacter]MDO8188666.1 PKD domain-containing protein [Conexibacter sp. CPCC 205706]MDO8199361.1 PKD domain-containing protein [Conexibacter sp. CPCC 205762]MDR9370839.1 PKD domain-containing protein [Conexibacter sp. JD483]